MSGNWNDDQGGRGSQQRSFGRSRGSGRQNGWSGGQSESRGRWGDNDDRGGQDRRQGGGFGGGRGRDGDQGSGSGEAIRFTIQKRDVGKIIGRGGSRIRDIQGDSGARINISRDSEDPYEVPVEITGNSDDRLKAKEIIDQLLSADSFSGGGGGGGGGGRGFDRREDRGGGFGADSRSGAGGGVTRFNIPKSEVGKVIGRGGSKIREIQDSTGASVKISREGDGYEIPVEITGSEADRQYAKDFIESIISADNFQERGFGQGGQDSQEVSRITIPKGDVGKIIGKGGSKIREIQEASGAGIKVIKNEESYHEAPVELKGSAESRQIAKQMIEEIIADDNAY